MRDRTVARRCFPSTRMPRYPRVAADKLRQEAALIAALLAGAVPQHLEITSMNFKPAPWRYTPDLSRVGNCTVCANQEAWRKAASTADLAPAGQPNLLIDEAPLSDWRGVVLVPSPTRPNPSYLIPGPWPLAPRSHNPRPLCSQPSPVIRDP